MGAAGAAIGIGTSLFSGLESQRSGEKLAGETEESIEFLSKQGRLGAEDISEAARAGVEASEAALGGIAPIQRFADVGTEAFTRGREGILSGRATSPAAKAIATGGMEAARGVGGNLSGAVLRGVERRARLAGESVQPIFERQLFQLGTRAGLPAVGDITGIKLRQAETAGDIQRQSGAQQAGALIGQAPAIGQLAGRAQEARLLGEAGMRQGITSAAQQAAQYVGSR